MASGPTMRPMGVPLRRRFRTSKQMCHPAAPMEMKRRPMLVQSVRRVPPPKASSSHRVSKLAPLVLKHLGSVGSRHRCFGNVRRGCAHRGELHRDSGSIQASIGVEGRPLAQVRWIGNRSPDFFRRVAQFSRQERASTCPHPFVPARRWPDPACTPRDRSSPAYQRISCVS